MASGVFQESGDRPRERYEAEMKALANDLELLVDGMEDEMRETGCIGVDASERLSALRRRFEELVGSSGT